MNAKDLRIIFLGTPEFAKASLEALVVGGYNVVAVITAPDKPAGRGMQLQQSEVKKFAVAYRIPVLQPVKLKEPEFLQELKGFNADVQVVVAFRMLPELVWNMPTMGTINVHASLLPQYRGAAPINWVLINGEMETGVTTFKLQHQIDTGNILLQSSIPVLPTITAGELHDQLKDLGAKVMLHTLEELATGNLNEIPQPESSSLKHAPKIFTETGRIDWSETVDHVFNLVRGLSPYPAAYCELNSKACKVFRVEKQTVAHTATIGSYSTDHKTFLRFASADGFIYMKEIQIQGKKRMAIGDFLRGFRD